MTPPRWEAAVRVFREWQRDEYPRTFTVSSRVESLGGEWCDDTGGGCPVGFIRLLDGTVATIAPESILRWPGHWYSDLGEYLAADMAGETICPLDCEVVA